MPHQKPKISIITVSFNSIKTIKETLESVKCQTYDNVEHIIIDGGSNDGTVELCKNYPHVSILISEKDNGIYDAINKGILQSTGDIIGILHSDDVFYRKDILEIIVNCFDKEEKLKIFLGDIIQIKYLKYFQIKRLYQSKNWSPKRFAWGVMPAHPAFFCKKEVYSQSGLYKVNYKIAGDFEFLIRVLLRRNFEFKYFPIVTTIMKVGGASTKNLISLIDLNIEIKRACTENKVYTNFFMIYSKYFFKIFQLLPNFSSK